jgi:hypothetical protein
MFYDKQTRYRDAGASFSSDFECVQYSLAVVPAHNNTENRIASFEIIIHD